MGKGECSVCRKEKDREKIISHHVSYIFDKTISVCVECHQKIHQTKDFYDYLKPGTEGGLSKKEYKEIGYATKYIKNEMNKHGIYPYKDKIKRLREEGEGGG